MKTITITLSEEDYDAMCFALGVATGQAINDRNPELAERRRQLFNRIQESAITKLEVPNLTKVGSEEDKK